MAYGGDVRKDWSLVTLAYDRILDERETKLSWFFVFDGRRVSLPKQFVEDIRETVKEVDVPQWLAEDREIEGFAV